MIPTRHHAFPSQRASHSSQRKADAGQLRPSQALSQCRDPGVFGTVSRRAKSFYVVSEDGAPSLRVTQPGSPLGEGQRALDGCPLPRCPISISELSPGS